MALSDPVQSVVAAIASARVDLSNEKAAQQQIAGVLTAAGIAHEREVRLAAADIPDFMVGALAVEVKLRGARKIAVFKQLERYCLHDRVSAILLVSNMSMTLPDTIHGKPAYFLSLGRSWL